MRTATGSAASSRSRVAACCSARVSVGAISAAWWPDSTARSIAYRAQTVLPEPTSPISSRCIGRSESRSRSIGERDALIGGELEGQRVEPASRQSGARGAELDPRRESRRSRRRVASTTWCEQLLERQSLARQDRLLAVGGEVKRPQGVGFARHPPARPQLGRQRLERQRRHSIACQCPLADPVRAQRTVAGWTATRPVVWMPLAESGAWSVRISCASTRKSPRRSSLPLSNNCVTGLEPLGEPGLVEPDRLQRPARVGDVGLDDPQVLRRVGRTRAERTATSTVARSPIRSSATSRTSERSR